MDRKRGGRDGAPSRNTCRRVHDEADPGRHVRRDRRGAGRP